ncbi:MAG: hypothetical protein RIC03_12455 [Cyclobacteriaceae bacterium]
MKILKRPENILFDTDNPTKMEFSEINPLLTKTPQLHEVRTDPKTDYEFLSDHFKPILDKEHPIFRDFGHSFFYVIEDGGEKL